MMLYIFTEEHSCKIVFDLILPKLLPKAISFKVFPHQGKQDLERGLRLSMPAISKTPGAKILILMDQDSNDCKELKSSLKEIIEDKCHCEYSIRIICKELESWFLGDLYAIKAAYPRFKPELYASKSNFRNVDKITNPSKQLLKIIPEYAKRSSLPKLEVSESIANHLDIERNRSSSFKNTIMAISKLIAG